ncbi:unnamed protein product [Didymodactylos carnosus]|nr:unnamed protein product [Didymodactylos carnosus]CAF3758516.1 unnamed protein product [Didymodactylos carnosus]
MLNDTSNSPQRYLCRLQQLHESRGQSLNLHAFLNDLLIIVQRLLAQINIRRWQAAIDGCIVRQCPWFKTTFNNNQQLYYSIDSSSNHHSPLLPPPTQDHNYSLTNENYLMNLSSNYTSSESLIKYIDQDNTTYGDFTNLYQLDTRKCELCQTYSDRLSPPNIGRLISIGFKQWVHVGCILAAYSSQKLSPLDEPPYILRNIKDIIKQCQSKYTCHMCHKQGATVMCCEQDCNIRYHCDCIQKHYAQQQQIPSLNLVNGTLANLQTYCIKHYKKMNGETTTNDQIERISTETKQTNLSSNNIPIKPVKSINLSSTVYGDLNRELIGLNLDDLNLCIGSLQIHSIGNYDLLLDDDFDSDDCESNSSDNDDGSDEPTISKHLKLSHIYPNDYHSSRLYWSTKCAKNMTVYHLYISCESNYHNIRENHHNYEHGTSAQERQQIIHEQCQQYFKQLQMKIDEHRKEVKILSSSSTDKTTTHQQKQTSNIQLNKEKKKANNNNNVQKKTRELMSSASYENTSSVVKRQTPKSAIQNIRRPRDKNQCQKPSTKINHRPSPNINNKNYSNDIDSDKFNHRNSLTMKASNHYCHKVYSPNKTKEVMSVDFKTLQHLLPNISNREMSPSPFAILLAKALQQIQPTTLAIGPQPQASLSHAPILSYYLSSQQPNKDDNNNNNNINNINNNHKQQQHSSTNTVASDQLLQHLWKTMNSSKKHNESSQNQQPSKTSSTSHWRHMQQPNPLKKLQTNNDRIVQSNPQQTVDVVDLKIKSYQQIDQVDHQIKNHQLDTIDCLCVSENNKESSPIVLEADSVLLTDIVLSNKHKQNEQFPKDCLPQLDGCFDVDIDHNNDVDIDDVSQIIESLLDQIDQTNRQRSTSEHSLDLNGEYQLLDLNIELTPISPTKLHHQSPKKEQKCHKLSEDEIIEEYKRWKKSKYVQVKFRIQSDDGYEILSDDLNQAWATIVNLVRETRDDMKLTHLPLTLYDGHDAFGLNKTIVKTLLKQLQICTIKNYFQTQTTKKPLNESSSISPVQLPLSTSSSSSLKSMKMIVKQNEWYRKLILYKKQLKKQHRQYSKTTIYERKSHKRQRFGWLLNPSRKISYAKQTFEIDDALIHSRRIILEEASVSLRLYHLHYFSARCLLVGHSPIHGCGLFTLIDILEGQMIIEYSGEVIRPCLTDKRERENEGKGFGCYMFTVDSMHVIDATHRGNKARFINHSCEPNCFSKTVLCGGIKRIIIYALKDIQSGKELTYDYSFPEEDVKIPCCCRTDNCRLYLN